MAEINAINLSASIVNDKRYSDLKTAIYEELVNKDHATVVSVFKTLQEWATEAEDNKFEVIDRPKNVVSKVSAHDLDLDPDLDDSLTPDELSQRK